jgi:zona occludens toxin
MAILFFEGLPGAGKSYEAMVTQIIPALKSGREVVAYIEGLNFIRIAEAAEISLDDVKRLLFPLTRDQMKGFTSTVGRKEITVDGDWINHVRDNALHVFDEAQNWWGLRLKATDKLTEFISEHRHRGMDILLMGQSLKDLSALWRRRVDQKLGFLKLTALGTAKRYRVTVYKGQGDDKYVKVTTKVGKYEARYFGCYASHNSDGTNTATYTDGRVKIWNSWGFKFGIPIVLALGVLGFRFLWGFFHPAKVAPVVASVSLVPAARSVSVPVPAASVPAAVPRLPASAPDRRSYGERYLADLSGHARVRLAGIIGGHGRRSGVIEWWDGSRVVERLSLDELQSIGVKVAYVGPDAVHLAIGGWDALATEWPVADPVGVVSEREQTQIAGGDASGGVYTRQQIAYDTNGGAGTGGRALAGGSGVIRGR